VLFSEKYFEHFSLLVSVGKEEKSSAALSSASGLYSDVFTTTNVFPYQNFNISCGARTKLEISLNRKK
jgi:hypothetical protein